MKQLWITKITCLKCKHRWVPRVAKPVKCPKCQDPNWNELKVLKGGKRK